MSEESTQLAAPFHAWLPSYVNAITTKNRLNELGITLDPVAGVEVTEEVTDDGIRAALMAFSEVSDKNRIIMLMMDRYMGQLVIAYADKHDTDWATAISDLDLEGITGKSYNTLRKLPRIAATVPDRLYHLPHITSTHMDVVTGFSGPIEDYERMQEFNRRRWDLVQTVSDCPDDWPKSRITNEMRKIQMDLGVTPRRMVPISFTVDRFLRTSIMLLNFTEGDFEALGTTRGEAMTHWESYQAELIERGKIEATVTDPHEFTLPWALQEPEPEAVEVEAEAVAVAESQPEAPAND